MRAFFEKKMRNLSLEGRIRLTYAVVITPIIILLMVCALILHDENKRYDDLVDAAGSASQFSLDFKDDFDYETYLVIVESKSFAESELRSMLKEAESNVELLKQDIDLSSENGGRLEDIEKYLHNLGVYTDRIEENLIEGDKYDENIEIWENDVQIVTALIRESIIQFIYYELQDIQKMRSETADMYARLLTYLIVAAVAVVALLIAISYYLSRSITKPIKHLSNVTERVSSGDLSVRANLDAGAEVGVLAKSLDGMIDRINQLLVQVRDEQESLREAELELLQSQINPHFLYNTLDTIVWLAEAGDQQQVVKMVGNLSDFFRTSLNGGRDIITLKDELKHVNSYLEIQQIRYQDILEYEVNVPEDLYENMIPKITLQPLVENALYHGIKNKRGKGHITITGEIVGNFLMLYVEDNGIGITEERLGIISDKFNNAAEKDDDVFGLRNVNERIQLKFGKRYGLHIDSTYGEGTKVSVLLPLENSESR